MSKVKLKVLGVSYSQTQSGAYALVLSEENGDRRIPIIVGGFEAQAIAIQLEGLNPPRPLTHDLFLNFAMAFHVELLEVMIYKLEEGIFYSKLTCSNGAETIQIDSRTSDAIALALRFKCAIYTSEDIMRKASIIIDFDAEPESGESSDNETDDDESNSYSSSSDVLRPSFSNMTMDELKQALGESVTAEDYERASLIRDEINRRNPDSEE
jgi:bifunctional DNase/RNase